jgi:hypothetical protein
LRVLLVDKISLRVEDDKKFAYDVLTSLSRKKLAAVHVWHRASLAHGNITVSRQIWNEF